MWLKSIVNPIPKNPSEDPRMSLHDRGISLMSTDYKLYSTEFNERLILEREGLPLKEKNGFHKSRL